MRQFSVISVIASFWALIGLSGCFTGVESTPKITYKEVRNAHASEVSPEQQLALSFASEPFAKWKPGKRFYVVSPRISLALSAPEGTSMPQAGDTIVYAGYSENVGLTGSPLVELSFNSNLRYRTNSPLDDILKRPALEVPFAIDLDLVDMVADSVRGRRVFVKTPLWFTTEGQSYGGRKFVEVEIVDILPANEVYPLKIVFRDERGELHALYMNAGSSSRWAPRDFAALFAFTDPRASYPAISTEMWTHIVNTRPAIGMTKHEASLAVGTPQNIDRGHNQSSAYERWNYTDGRYLIFEDGLLVKFNR